MRSASVRVLTFYAHLLGELLTPRLQVGLRRPEAAAAGSEVLEDGAYCCRTILHLLVERFRLSGALAAIEGLDQSCHRMSASACTAWRE